MTRALLRSELLKLRSLPSTYLVIAAAVSVGLGVGLLEMASTAHHWLQLGPQDRASFDPVADSFSGFQFAELAFGALGVLAITSEYATGTMHATLVASPRRLQVYAREGGRADPRRAADLRRVDVPRVHPGTTRAGASAPRRRTVGPPRPPGRPRGRAVHGRRDPRRVRSGRHHQAHRRSAHRHVRAGVPGLAGRASGRELQLPPRPLAPRQRCRRAREHPPAGARTHCARHRWRWPASSSEPTCSSFSQPAPGVLGETSDPGTPASAWPLSALPSTSGEDEPTHHGQEDSAQRTDNSEDRERRQPGKDRRAAVVAGQHEGERQREAVDRAATHCHATGRGEQTEQHGDAPTKKGQAGPDQDVAATNTPRLRPGERRPRTPVRNPSSVRRRCAFADPGPREKAAADRCCRGAGGARSPVKRGGTAGKQRAAEAALRLK